MFLKNKNIIFKMKRSKVTDYAALINKLNNLPIKQHYYRTFSGLKFGNKFREYYLVSMGSRVNSSRDMSNFA